MRKILLSLFLVFLLSTAFYLPACNNKDLNYVSPTNIVLDKSEAILLAGDSAFTLTATVSPKNVTDNSVKWESSDVNVIKVSNGGVVTVSGAGRAMITATTVDNKHSTACEIYVGNHLVDKKFAEMDTVPSGCHTTIGAAVTAAARGDTIVIIGGDYKEDISTTKNLKLIGVDEPTLHSFNNSKQNATFSLTGLSFASDTFPAGGTASICIPAGGTAEIASCKFKINNEDIPVGGYAILAAAGSRSVTITDCKIENYRYAVYLDRTDGEILIKNNDFTNTQKGVGVDVRMPNSIPDTNYDAKGEIDFNHYNNVTLKTEFFFFKQSYDGKLKFVDYNKMIAEMGTKADSGD